MPVAKPHAVGSVPVSVAESHVAGLVPVSVACLVPAAGPVSVAEPLVAAGLVPVSVAKYYAAGPLLSLIVPDMTSWNVSEPPLAAVAPDTFLLDLGAPGDYTVANLPDLRILQICTKVGQPRWG